ncbi:hypothetical protein OG783_17115 [Streptomyces jietaisiensis]|uniref:hypothetical protein n=1 Tax=Streptomyces griseoaurantiacus TaxID=68213 RepID=UPI003246BECC
MSPGGERGYGDASSRGDEGGYGDGGYGGTGQTRTRLPDRPGDVYGGARRGRGGSSRSTVTVVAVVVLLIAAIAFANRGGGGGGGDGSGSASNGSRSGDRAKSAPTTATGKRPVDTKTSGIPTRYAHDQQGAQSAATNYTVALASAEMFDTESRHTIVDTVYAPDVVAKLRSETDKAYTNKKFLAGIGLDEDGKAPSGQTFVSRVVPAGTKIGKLTDGDHLSVEVWYSSLFGLAGASSTNPVTESWYTTTYDLTWVGGDWKITDSRQKDGPVPVGADQKASTTDDMAKAVEEYGGFTYAR